LCERHGVALRLVTYCTAVPDGPIDVRQRHLTYINALQAVGVRILKGHHIVDERTGKRVEKQTDINLALSLVRSADRNEYDCAYVVSGDSDQAATARFFREWFPHKRLIGVAPPDLKVPERLKPYSDDHFVMSWFDVERSVFYGDVLGRSGRTIPRPSAYAPPRKWIHPQDRAGV